ncbi:LLM class flavin-dependent oxidoreductase [Nocardioides sp.]|uniref:LLM class flavin-dependent oxidoreductase n=1 Tax=Nocardioides sp. TaxID=35761 RepID=UPI00261E586D|nr:LLM class flavin-dependent oxidoreductase [Nocardioides sp.]
MKVSLWPNTSNPVADILSEAAWADEQGWHGIWIADHYMPNTGTTERLDGPMNEAWTVLPAVATRTQRAQIGVLVAPTTVHHPALLANRAATLDQLSGGRFVLGLGAGWQINEHTAYGIDLRSPKDRVDRFEEAIQIVTLLLTEKRTTFTGSHFQIDDAPCEPKPVQERLPILVGTAGPRMLRITARYAAQWNSWGTPEVAATKLEALHAACEKVGRDPQTLWKSTNIMLDLDGRHPAPADRVLSGSAAELTDRIGRYAELGFDEFNLPSWNLGASVTERIDALAELQETVLAAVSGS